LVPDDVAYIPRGFAHDAHSTDAISLHITTGDLRYTWTYLLLEMVANASLNDARLRRALPPGFAKSTFDTVRAQETARILLQSVCKQSNFEAALYRLCPQPREIQGRRPVGRTRRRRR